MSRSTHYFYLAFEDSVCLDYVTEKAFLLKELIVPVVLSRRAVNSQLPEGSYIPADDYTGPEDLAKYLKYLIAHKEEYMEFFEWTKTFKRTTAIPRHSCEICEALKKGQKFHEEKDLHSWWQRDAACEKQNFAIRLGVPQPPPPIVKPLRPLYGDENYERYYR
uniref:Fucosyltransferase n=1 Tax=Steinernema glaseri TaxID=37863 RepID=A0A1I7YU18_9BILA